MWQDLAALTPPLVVCVAVLIGVAMLLRREMSPKRRAERDDPPPITLTRGLEIYGTAGFIPAQNCVNWATALAARSQ